MSENTKNIINLEGFNNYLMQNNAVLYYFSHEECNVCKVLKPKILEMIHELYPEIKFQYIDIKKAPEIAGQLRIFTVPTITIYFFQKEYIRKSRHIGISELADEIKRPYYLMF